MVLRNRRDREVGEPFRHVALIETQANLVLAVLKLNIVLSLLCAWFCLEWIAFTVDVADAFLDNEDAFDGHVLFQDDGVCWEFSL